MSKIDKLSILGVRSFEPGRSETIQFQSPLTLIVGPNGSGKTTIIECLKYVTTGDLPPNTKGGAFIHEPKLCGEKEIMAQVRLSFKASDGTKMTATRSLQLTVKKNTRQMKTLEGSLRFNRDGEAAALSSRVAEMDTMVPQYLGVSRAILDSVIFCHQEESLWPLSEPAKLKTRFDEIFEALKYTKAIDNIKDLAKKKRVELLGFKKDEEHTKVIKGKAEENGKRCTELFAKMEKQQVEADGLRKRLKDAAQKSEDAGNKAKAANLIVGDLRGKRIEAQTKEESVKSLKETLNEMSDSDEDLQRMLEQYDERVKVYQDDIDRQKAQYAELNNEIKQARNNVTSKERECGSYEAQKEHYDRQVESRERLVKEAARTHGIRGFDMDVGDEQVDAFMDRIGKMARDQNAAFDRARRETQEELQRAQKVLNQINEQKSVLNQRRDSAKQTIATNDKKINQLQTELNKIDVDEGSKATLESNLHENNSNLENAKSEQRSANWDSNIEIAETGLRQLDDRKEKLDAELVEGTRQAGDSARLDFVRRELKDRQGSLETMKGAHGDKISSIIGSGWTPASVESDFQRALDQSSSHLSDAEKQRDGISREMEQVEYKLNACKADLKSKKRDHKAAEDAIRSALDVEPAEYPEELKKIEESRDIIKADAEAFSKVLQYFDSCIKAAKDHNGCRTCNRKFNNSQELDAMLKAVEKEKKKFEADDKANQEIAEAEKDLQDAKAVGANYELWQRLGKDIPGLEVEEKRLTDKRAELIRQLEEQDELVSSRQAARRDIERLSKNVQNIAKYNTEISSFEGQIEELTAKQKSAGLSRGLEIIQEDIKKVNEESKTVKTRLAKTMNDRDRSRALINKLELEKRDIEGKLSNADHQIKERKSLESQIEEYKGLTDEQRHSIKSIDREKQDLEPQLLQAQAKYDDISRRGADKDRELQTALNKLNSSLSELKKADQDVKAYIEKGGPQQLARGMREVEKLKAEVTRLEQEQGSIVREVKTLEDQFRNHSETKKSIADNQRYRRDLRQLQRVRTEIEELESHNAETDKAYYEHEGTKWQTERNKLAAEEASIMGSMRSMDDQLKQLQNDWATDYKDAAKKYKEAHIMVETAKACVEDLGRYGNALDAAIIKYHTLKMEEINRIIAELWRSTYQGTDVDTIMIRSETEGGTTKKNHNYRVVMVKQDTEMDMRGRCSAGQKVLASIIIRLALAECFGVNCGVIALDEPTTNLDHDNIQALAKSLYEIIQMRKQQRNFQLIVITHDEDFLRAMQCSDFTEKYWRVSRNAKQTSQIEKQNVSEVI